MANTTYLSYGLVESILKEDLLMYVFAKWPCALLPCSVTSFGEEPNSHQPPRHQPFFKSHPIQHLAVPDSQDGAQKSSFCLHSINSTEETTALTANPKDNFPVAIPAVAGLLRGSS
jgi:hypothetical protein